MKRIDEVWGRGGSRLVLGGKEVRNCLCGNEGVRWL